jgi:hypothetical protein
MAFIGMKSKSWSDSCQSFHIRVQPCRVGQEDSLSCSRTTPLFSKKILVESRSESAYTGRILDKADSMKSNTQLSPLRPRSLVNLKERFSYVGVMRPMQRTNKPPG